MTSQILGYSCFQFPMFGVSCDGFLQNKPRNKISSQVEEIRAKFVVCDAETESEVRRALRGSDVCLLSVGSVEGGDCDDLAVLAERKERRIRHSVKLPKLYFCVTK